MSISAPPPPGESVPSVLVVGCGGIGGIVAADLAELGARVTAATGNAAVTTALNARGATVREDGAERTVTGIRAVDRVTAADGPFDVVLLATQPPATERALAEAAPALAATGRVVCFQNGLMEERAARMVGAERVVGGVVAWGGSQVEPGVYDRTAAGGFVLGTLRGPPDEPLRRIAALLESVGPVDITENLPGARWSKLAINCAISTLGTLCGDRLGVVMRQRFIRRLALELMTETVAVARAEKVRLEKVSGTLDLDWMALTEAERTVAGSPGLFAKHTMLLAVGARYRRLRSSMLAAIERGRPPAVDFLNGEVVERGRTHGIPTPVNAEAQRMVHELASGKLKPAMDTARALFDRTAHLRVPG